MSETDTLTPSEEKDKIYTSDRPGLEAAAEELTSSRGEVEEVKASEDAPAELTTKEAAAELTKYHKQVADERKAIEDALGLHNVEPTPEEQLEARVRELETSRTSEQSAPEADYYQPVEQLSAFERQAQQQTEAYRQQLIQNYNNEFPDIQSVEDVQRVGSYDPARAASAVQYWQQCEAAYSQQQQHLAGQQALVQEAVSHWGATQDRAFVEQNPELKDPAAMAKAGEAARKVLSDLGLSENDIRTLWHNGTIRNVAAQNLILKAARYELAKSSLKTAKRPVPPKVVRPGVGGGSARSQHMDALNKRLDYTGSVRDAAALYSARKGQ